MSKKKKTHTWRKCPSGHHWRNPTYVATYPKKGKTVKGHHRKGSCVKNPSRKDQIYQDDFIGVIYYFHISSDFMIQLSMESFGQY